MAITSLKSKEVLSNLTAPANIDLGAMIPISTVTIGSTATQYIQFTSIPQNYSHLQIRGLGRIDAGGGAVSLRINFNADTAGANYYNHWLYGNGTTASNTSGTYGVSAYLAGSGAFANVFGTFIIDVLDYSDTNKNKTTRILGGYDNNGSGTAALCSNLWLNTSAISSIWLFGDIGSFVQYSSFALYGIKKAGA